MYCYRYTSPRWISFIFAYGIRIRLNRLTFKQILSDIQIFQAGSIFTVRLIKTFVPPWFISKQWCCNKTTYANGFNCVKHSSRLSTKKPLSIYLTGWQDIAFSPPHRVLPLDAWIHLVIHRGEYLARFIFTMEFTHFWKCVFPLGTDRFDCHPSKDLFRGQVANYSSQNYFILKYRSNLENIILHNWKLKIVWRFNWRAAKFPSCEAKETLKKIIIRSQFEHSE